MLTKLAKDEQEKKRVDKVKPPPEKGEEQRPSPNKARVAVKAKQQIAKEASKTATRTAAKKGGKARSGKKTVATKKGSVKDADEDELQGDDNEDHQKPATVTARKKGFR